SPDMFELTGDVSLIGYEKHSALDAVRGGLRLEWWPVRNSPPQNSMPFGLATRQPARVRPSDMRQPRRRISQVTPILAPTHKPGRQMTRAESNAAGLSPHSQPESLDVLLEFKEHEKTSVAAPVGRGHHAVTGRIGLAQNNFTGRSGRNM